MERAADRRPPIDVDRARGRASAYVYGDILVMAVLLSADAATLAHGEALLGVAAVTVTTYLAHVVAHAVGQRIGRNADEHLVHLRQELRDALPIVSAGVLPTVLLAASGLHLLPALVAQLIAVGIVALRLAAVGWVVARWTGEPRSTATVLAGVGLAVAGAIVIVLKVLLTH